MTVEISFEVFPPKTANGLDELAAAAARLARVRPAFISVTFGAGGSSRDRSFDAIKAVATSSGSPIAGHLTCVGQPTVEVDAVIDRYRDLGIEHVVALRGDPDGGADAIYKAHPKGYQQTSDLVRAIKSKPGTLVSVSAYPERHPQSPNDAHDIAVLAQKIEAGADQAITQMFFDNAPFYRYRDRVRAAGIQASIVPGIFPVHSISAVSRFASKCGATMPDEISRRFERVSGDERASFETAADVAAEQIDDLASNGVKAVHLYTLNRADLALAVCDRIGVGHPVGTR
jgi:methylenetetrahydrofolate reductase (NADPH)